MSPRIVVYSSVTGGYDPIVAPQRVEARVDYLFFTDARAVPAPWRWMPMPEAARSLDAKDQQRFVKILPHRIEALAEYDLSIYIDGSISIVGDVLELVSQVSGREEPIFIHQHPSRDCLYAEGFACAYYGLDWIWSIDRQLARYRAAGFPARRGLFEASVLVRRKTPALARFMETWWSEYCAGVRRDQLSLTYAAWKEGVEIGSLGPSDPRHSQRIFRLTPHPARFRADQSLKWRTNRWLARHFSFPALDRRMESVAAPGQR